MLTLTDIVLQNVGIGPASILPRRMTCLNILAEHSSVTFRDVFSSASIGGRRRWLVRLRLG
jgi:hypothetical protein